MLRFMQVCRIIIIIALLWSLPYLLVPIAGTIEGTLETYPLTPEQLRESRLEYISIGRLMLLIDGIGVTLLVFVQRFIRKLKDLKKS